MKTYNEMTQSVLQRAKAGIAEQKRRRRNGFAIAASGLCLALVLVTAAALWKQALAGVPVEGTGESRPTISMEGNETTQPQQTEETETTQPEVLVSTGNVYFLNATEDQVSLEPLVANMTLPIDNLFRVRSLKGLTDAQISEAISEEYAFQATFRERMHETVGEGGYGMYRSDEVIIQHLSAGVASLVILDNSQIESVTWETTGVLATGESYAIIHRDYTIGEGESAVTIPAGSRRIYLDCDMKFETRKIFEENLETPLSTIRDTITVTIHYKDGTKEIVIIDVTVDDDGQIYMTQRGNDTGV